MPKLGLRGEEHGSRERWAQVSHVGKVMLKHGVGNERNPAVLTSYTREANIWNSDLATTDSKERAK